MVGTPAWNWNGKEGDHLLLGHVLQGCSKQSALRCCQPSLTACAPGTLQGRFVVAFSHTVDAVRFCHAGQTSILYAHWPAAAHEVSGGQQDMPDGRPLWKGPRVAMAVHETDEYM